MFENELIRVLLCCNDPDNGQCDGRLSAVEIGPNMAFDARQWVGPRFAWIGANRFRIAGKQFAFVNYKNWYGNWCWDGVTMRGSEVLRLLNWPRFRVFFDVGEGEERLFNWFRAERPWTDHDLRLIGKDFDRLGTGN